MEVLVFLVFFALFMVGQAWLARRAQQVRRPTATASTSSRRGPSPTRVVYRPLRIPEAEAPSPPVRSRGPHRQHYNAAEMRRAVVLAAILGPPKGRNPLR